MNERRDAFGVLGVSRDATIAQLRAAFRARVHALHPDRNTDSGAAEELRRVIAAYERAVALRTGRPRRDRPQPPRRAPVSRFVCAQCREDYSFGDTCPRCNVALHDRTCETFVAPPEDPRVAKLVATLEARGEPTESVLWAHAPASATVFSFVCAFLAYGVYPPVGVMFGLYGMWLTGLHVSQRIR